MKVEFKATDTVNGNTVGIEDNYLTVTIDGLFWGWVSGPTKGVRVRKGWVALRNNALQWGPPSVNKEAALLAAL